MRSVECVALVPPAWPGLGSRAAGGLGADGGGSIYGPDPGPPRPDVDCAANPNAPWLPRTPPPREAPCGQSPCAALPPALLRLPLGLPVMGSPMLAPGSPGRAAMLRMVAAEVGMVLRRAGWGGELALPAPGGPYADVDAVGGGRDLLLVLAAVAVEVGAPSGARSPTQAAEDLLAALANATLLAELNLAWLPRVRNASAKQLREGDALGVPLLAVLTAPPPTWASPAAVGGLAAGTLAAAAMLVALALVLRRRSALGGEEGAGQSASDGAAATKPRPLAHSARFSPAELDAQASGAPRFFTSNPGTTRRGRAAFEPETVKGIFGSSRMLGGLAAAPEKAAGGGDPDPVSASRARVSLASMGKRLSGHFSALVRQGSWQKNPTEAPNV